MTKGVQERKTGAARVFDMTSGPVLPAIAMFSLPIFVTSIFQQLYVTVDGIILGQFVGNVALAAVSNCGYLISTIICFFNGVSTGAGVVLAQLFGAHEDECFGRAVWTSGALALVAGILVMVACMGLARPCLALMNLSGEVLDQGVIYMVTYAVSTLPMTICNMGCAVFRAYGDSRTPMVVLVSAALANIGFALLLVVGLGLGVFGAALGCVLAQLLAAMLTVCLIWRNHETCHIAGTRPVPDRALMRRMLSIGIPNGIQISVICVSSIIISAEINRYGLAVMDGFGAYTKIDGWFYLLAEAIQAGIMTFVGQNLGAGQYKRVRHGVARGLALNMVILFVVCAVALLARRQIIGLFSSDPAVIDEGVRALVAIVPLYAVYAAFCSLCGLFDGVGSTRVPMVLSLVFMCAVRVIWVLAARMIAPGPIPIYLSYPATWVMIVLAMLAYYRWGSWNHAQDIRGK